jgi:hypothetical protein
VTDFGPLPDSEGDEPEFLGDPEEYMAETINQLLGGKTVIGVGEQEARQFLGDDRYDELMKYQDSLAEANRDAHFAQNELTRAYAARHQATARLLDTTTAILSKWLLRGQQVGR